MIPNIGGGRRGASFNSPPPKKHTKGIIHGSQASAFFGDKSLYYALISIWRKEGGDLEFNLGDYKGSFYSKRSGLRKEGKGLFEYVIYLKSGFRTLYLNFSPRVRGMAYGKGKEWKLNERQGEGVAVSIKASYLYFDEIEEIILSLFKRFNLERFYGSWNKEESYLISLEDHIRYHERKERSVIRVFEDIWLLVGLTEEYQAEHKIDKKKAGYKFAKVVTDKWNELGFENKGLFFYVKSYRGEKFPNIRDAIIKHPKLEIGLDPYYNKGNRPKWKDWKRIFDLEEEIRGNIAIWSGISVSDLVEDAMFKVLPNQVEVKEWRPEKLKIYYMERAKEVYPDIEWNPSKAKTIYIVAKEGSVDVKEVAKEIGITERGVRKIIRYFEDKGILKRVRTYGNSFIEFENPLVEKVMSEKIELMSNLAPFERSRKLSGIVRKKIDGFRLDDEVEVEIFTKVKTPLKGNEHQMFKVL